MPQFIFLTVGGAEQLLASETLSDGSAATPPPTCWSSSDAKIVNVSPQGMASALATGTATITCTDAGVTASTAVIVQPAFSTSAYQSGTLLYLQNTVGADVLRLGMDTSFGGAIGEVSLNGSDVVAKASYGSHFFGVGLYDGDDVYDSCNGCTLKYGWDPVECCDTYRHGSPVLAQTIDGDTIYIKSNPLQWIPDNKGGGPALPVPSDIIMEKWISPVANHPYVFQVRYKLTHTGTDRHAEQFNAVPAYELAASLFSQFDFYTGTAAGTGAPATILLTFQLPQFPASSNVQWVSEDWGALTNQQDFGFAAYNPQAFPYSTASLATTDPTDQVVGFSFLTPLSFFPGSSVQFDNFLMLGNYKTMQLETYDIKRRLGPFPDTAPPFGVINATPASGSTISGQVSIDGFAFENASDTSVELYVDDVLKASGFANIARPDVALALPGAPLNCAFHFDLNTTQLINGQHTIEVRAKDAAGNVGLLPHRVVIVQN
jgi:hypothetical protein